jgi:uncharacterized RDD family membrane protein YckC
MKPRFEPDLDTSGVDPSIKLIDPEAYDAGEQQFAASLEVKPATRRFVVDDTPAGYDSLENGSTEQVPTAASPRTQEIVTSEDPQGTQISSCSQTSETPVSLTTTPLPAADSWRDEVAAKMSRYRANKRPRTPRYPSLQLKFEAVDSGSAVRALPVQPDASIEEEDVVLAKQETPEPPAQRFYPASAAPAGRILEFPLPLAPPPLLIEELAEPVLDRPRIMEVPEVVPPPPAMGGILMEAVEAPSREKRLGFELPLIAAPFPKRLLATGIDALIVGSAFGLFAYTFFRITSLLPPLLQAAGIAGPVLALFWVGYEYVLLVHAGMTPGLKLAGLRLSRFDGTDVPLKLRRWRVLASLLSGLSVGLGYAWCFLDEDRLCWHDRITHTYMAPSPPK